MFISHLFLKRRICYNSLGRQISMVQLHRDRYITIHLVDQFCDPVEDFEVDPSSSYSIDGIQ